jgi:hypothetical protein
MPRATELAKIGSASLPSSSTCALLALLLAAVFQFSATAANAADLRAPTVAITAPAPGATISGTVTVRASASDNVGVVGVQFFANGAPMGAEDTAAPFSVIVNTTTTANGTYTLTAVARDAAGNRTTSAPVTVIVANKVPDTSPPTVGITSPAPGASLSGTITVTANAADNVGVVGVQFFANGAPLGAEDTVAPYSVVVDTTTTANGTYSLTAVARDVAGNRATSAPITITVVNGSTPYAGAPISIPGSFEAENFDLGGEGVGYHDNVKGNAGGQYRLGEDVDIVTSTDSTGGGYIVNNFETGEWLAYTINVAANALYDIEIRASTTFSNSAYHVEIDGKDVTGATVVPNTGNWSTFQWSGRKGVALTAGKHVLKIVSNQQYFNLNSIRVTTAVGDITPPTVGITSPAPGTAVSGTITVTANASDNVAVTGVQFKFNGNNLGAEIATAPYSVSADTTTVADGSYTLTAVARDATGNLTTSAPVVITVGNAADTTPPAVGITSPAPGATVSGTITVTANASDNVGVTGVQFKFSGNNLGTEAVTAPYSVNGDTTTVANGQYTLTAVARDAAGNLTTSAPVTVTVSNQPPADTTPPTVGITSPASGTTVSGAMTVTANVSDNVGVAGVQFKFNGGNMGPEVIAAPYAYVADTTTVANGPYTLTAVARDAAGNLTTSAPVTVTVSNISSPPATGANLLFKSGFEGAISLSPFVMYSNGAWQDISGTDSETGYAWPPRIWGGSGRLQLIAGDGLLVNALSLVGYTSNEIQTVTGRSGAPTRALYSSVLKGSTGTNQNNGTTQSDFHVFPGAAGQGDVYLSYWLKFQPDLLQNMTINAWSARVVTDWKTGVGTGGSPGADYRIIMSVFGDRASNRLYWNLTGDNLANGGLPQQVFWELNNYTAPVPVGQWFRVEIFVHRSAGGDGRVWVAANGQTLFDRYGSNMGINNLPWNRIMPFLNYSQGALLPAYQWMDDLEIWDGFPSTASPH